MSTIHLSIGERVVSFDAEAQRSVLDQALARGLSINYSCKRGECGQCVGELLSGEVAPADATRPCIDELRIYLCNAVPRSDITVRVPHMKELERIRVVRSPCKIHSLIYLSPNVVQVELRLPPATNFLFVPGQYIRLTSRDRVTRSYSLAHGPRADNLLQIHVRRVANGVFSRYLFEYAKAGDLMHLEGPMGRFVMGSREPVSKTIFLATGTGIAPIHAILSSLNSEQLAQAGEVALYWGNRFSEDAYHRVALFELAHRLNFKYFEVFSRSDPNPIVRHVPELMATHHPDLADAQIFASGNPAMIDSGRRRGVQLGLRAEQFFADPFTAS